MNYKIDGIEKLDKKFDQLEELNIAKALNRACIIIENRARENAPAETGELRRSITHEVDQNVGYVGSALSYSPYVEIGTGIFSSRGDGRQDRWSYKDEEGEWHSTIGQRPQPFLSTALHEEQNNAMKEFNEEIQRQIKELAKK